MMNERIDAIIAKYCDGKKRIFADKCGVTPQTISVWYKAGFNLEALDRIRRAFPQVSIQWVETGTGEMDAANRIINEEINALRQQIEQLKEELAEKDKHINTLLSLLSANQNS